MEHRPFCGSARVNLYESLDKSCRAAQPTSGPGGPGGSALGSAARVTVHVAVDGSFATISEVADGASPVWERHLGVLPARTTVAYRLASDTWNGASRVQLIVEHALS